MKYSENKPKEVLDKRQFSLAFIFIQLACIAVALGAARAVVIRVSRSGFGPPLGIDGLLLIAVCFAALGTFCGGLFGRPVIGGIVGLISIPVLVIVICFLAVVADTFQIHIPGPWNV
jgi:hypothetical protein